MGNTTNASRINAYSTTAGRLKKKLLKYTANSRSSAVSRWRFVA
jgi:hypothetical protein